MATVVVEDEKVEEQPQAEEEATLEVEETTAAAADEKKNEACALEIGKILPEFVQFRERCLALAGLTCCWEFTVTASGEDHVPEKKSGLDFMYNALLPDKLVMYRNNTLADTKNGAQAKLTPSAILEDVENMTRDELVAALSGISMVMYGYGVKSGRVGVCVVRKRIPGVAEYVTRLVVNNTVVLTIDLFKGMHAAVGTAPVRTGEVKAATCLVDMTQAECAMVAWFTSMVRLRFTADVRVKFPSQVSLSEQQSLALRMLIPDGLAAIEAFSLHRRTLFTQRHLESARVKREELQRRAQHKSLVMRQAWIARKAQTTSPLSPLSPTAELGVAEGVAGAAQKITAEPLPAAPRKVREVRQKKRVIRSVEDAERREHITKRIAKDISVEDDESPESPQSPAAAAPVAAVATSPALPGPKWTLPVCEGDDDHVLDTLLTSVVRQCQHVGFNLLQLTAAPGFRMDVFLDASTDVEVSAFAQSAVRYIRQVYLATAAAAALSERVRPPAVVNVYAARLVGMASLGTFGMPASAMPASSKMLAPPSKPFAAKRVCV